MSGHELPLVEPRHREAAVLAVRGPECNPNERGTALHWARTGMTYLENAYAAEERVARAFATLEAHGGEWIPCPSVSEFTRAPRDMPAAGQLVLFARRTPDGPRGLMGTWDPARRVWVDETPDVGGDDIEYQPSEISHWRPYPALPEHEPAIESAEVASG